MRTVIEQLDALLADIKGRAESVDSDIADRENDFRSMCFWNIHNRAVMTKEIVTFYETAWRKMDVPIDLEHEITERMVTVTRDMFVDTVSSIEKAAKDCTGAYPRSGIRERSLEKGPHLYLRNIVAASAGMGCVTQEDLRRWDDVLMMRNLVTHNNSVADRSRVFELDGLRIPMRPNRMMKGPTDTFVRLTGIAVGLFHEWLVTVDGMFG